MNAKKLELVSYAHSVGESSLHLQFTPKYRKKVFRDKDVLAECRHLFEKKAQELGVQLAGLGFGPDHCHLFISGWKNVSIAQLAQHFKGNSSKAIREKYPVRLTVHDLYGDQLWSDGYFHRTVGAVTAETMKRYVTESQQKHWKAEKPKPAQTTLLTFN